MGQALYRKYRSKSLSEIVGQEHIITTLQNALKKGSISHAYLFTGPRGTGKTSIARILAHEINELEYSGEPHIDIIEIDAASNRRIDEIRDLRDKVHIAPTSSKYKVYIIDEVHMLTKEAFNALLKTLEEPPAHVIFILATTESHKLPETIISRTQRFTFKSIDSTKAVKHLRELSDKEGINISDEALELIAESGDGGLRDSVGLLDQISSQGGKIEADDVRAMLGVAPAKAITALYEATLNGSPKNILDELQAVQERGYEPSLVAKQLAQFSREKLLNGSSDGADLTKLLNQLIEVPASSDPAAKLEVVLLGINLSRPGNSETTKLETLKTKEEKPSKSVPAKVEAPVATVAEEKVSDVVSTDNFDEAWANVLKDVKKQYNTLYGVLRMAQPALDDKTVTLSCQYPFHQKRLKETKNRQILIDLMSQQLGYPVAVDCVVSDSKSVESVLPTASENTPAPALDTISNIFGATEVLES